MSPDDIRTWIGIVADIGVVAGFVLLVVQMRQTAEELRQRRLFDAIDIPGTRQELAFMGTTAHAAHAKAVFRPETLTESDVNQVWSHLNVLLFGALVTWNAWRRGELAESAWLGTRDAVCEAFGFAVGRIVWRHRKHVYPPGFVAAIDEGLAHRPADELERCCRAMMVDVQALASRRGDSTDTTEGSTR